MIMILSLLLGFAIGIIGLLFLRSERIYDKLLKTEDALAQLANKENFFIRKNCLIRDDELAFYAKLQAIVENNYYLFPQVHLSDLVSVQNNVRDHENLYQLLGNKSVDYVIFSKPEMCAIVAIELNGESHLMANRKNRDQLVSSVLEKVGIKFLPVDKNNYNFEELKMKILSLLA
jgi:hypothetical protein